MFVPNAIHERIGCIVDNLVFDCQPGSPHQVFVEAHRPVCFGRPHTQTDGWTKSITSSESIFARSAIVWGSCKCASSNLSYRRRYTIAFRMLSPSFSFWSSSRSRIFLISSNRSDVDWFFWFHFAHRSFFRPTDDRFSNASTVDVLVWAPFDSCSSWK